MKYYKLTDANGRTYNNTQWGENVTHEATGKGKRLCSGDCIHVYDSPIKALIFNPLHVKFKNPQLWECECENVVADDKTKIGVRKCTTVKQIPMPELTLAQRIAFGILCAKKAYKEAEWNIWADNWLSGKDRSASAARAAAYAAADAAAYAAADAVAYAAASADYAVDIDFNSIYEQARKIK